MYVIGGQKTFEKHPTAPHKPELGDGILNCAFLLVYAKQSLSGVMIKWPYHSAVRVVRSRVISGNGSSCYWVEGVLRLICRTCSFKCLRLCTAVKLVTTLATDSYRQENSAWRRVIVHNDDSEGLTPGQCEKYQRRLLVSPDHPGKRATFQTLRARQRMPLSPRGKALTETTLHTVLCDSLRCGANGTSCYGIS